MDYSVLASQIKTWSEELGFNQCGITDTALETHEKHFLNWINDGFHGDLHYMEKHGLKRSRPDLLEAGTVRVISVKMNYLPDHAVDAWEVLGDRSLGYVSRYALGRDYHKLMRRKLQKLADRMTESVGPFGYRAFVDSAPVLEKALAEKAGLGWIGKHSNLLTREGSWFFLGEIYTDLELPVSATYDNDQPVSHCGSCTKCIDECPTNAIVAPFRVDARRCISYLTIEFRGSIPLEFRPLIGNRVYGCDDCQLVCPWNRFSDSTGQPDFEPRHQLDKTPLTELFAWSEEEFLQRFEGSPIRRIGYECWLRNIAVALGNAPATNEVVSALNRRANDPLPLVQEHARWALDHQKQVASTTMT